jgi:hypothetical protein
MSDALPTEVTILTDVNVLAIGLTEDHPAHEKVYPWIQHALDGPNVLLIFDYGKFEAKASPFRAGMKPTNSIQPPSMV